MKIKKIYFDLDGVLADFDRGVKELCGLEPVDQSNKKPADDDRFFEAIKNVGNFYNKLELINGAKKMFQYIDGSYPEDCEILSGIPKPKRGITTAAADKTEWVHRNLGENIKVNIVFREEKKNFVLGPACILIDDYAKNIEEWEKAGGTGILFTTAEETLAKLREIEINLGGNGLLSTPYYGWTMFYPDNKQYQLSYLTAIPLDWLGAAIWGLENLKPFSVHGFCEPGRMICTVDYWNCHIIYGDDKDRELEQGYVNYHPVHVNMMDFCKALYKDISNDIDDWAVWMCEARDNSEVFMKKREEIQDRLERLYKLITEKEKFFKGKYFFS